MKCTLHRRHQQLNIGVEKLKNPLWARKDTRRLYGRDSFAAGLSRTQFYLIAKRKRGINCKRFAAAEKGNALQDSL